MDRIEYIRKHFLDMELTRQSLDIYVPRHALLKAIKECLPQFQGEILDVGCGQMPYRELILDSNKRVSRYTGLDLQRSSVHDTSIADLHWDGKHIPLDENSIDTAISTEVLEHSFHPTQTLLEINRVLRPGALFFFTVPFIWPLHEVPYDAYRFTPFSLKMHLQEARFTDIDIRPLGGWHASFAQMLGLWVKESKLTGWRKKTASKIAKRLIPYLLRNDVTDKNFSHHSMITGLYGTATKQKTL